jgi:hypothetical protein
LDHVKEFSWKPFPHDVEKPISYRPSNPSKYLTSAGFKAGAPAKGGLFDKAVRVLARDGTAAPDRNLLEWTRPGRASHSKAFGVGCYPLESRNDRGFIGNHPMFPDSSQPFHDYELQFQQTQHPFLPHGFRPNAKKELSSRTNKWRPSSDHSPLTHIGDRNPRLWSARNSTGMDFHDGEGARNPRF